MLRSYNIRHFLKSARIRNFFGPYFPSFGLNMVRYFVYQKNSKYGSFYQERFRSTEAGNAISIFLQRKLLLIKSCILYPVSSTYYKPRTIKKREFCLQVIFSLKKKEQVIELILGII